MPDYDKTKIDNYIKIASEKGYTETQIKHHLLNLGYKAEDIEKHFKGVEPLQITLPKIFYRLFILVVTLLFISALNLILLNYNAIIFNSQVISYFKYDKIVTKADELCIQGKYDEAFRNLDKALTIDPSRARAFAARGDCYYKQKKYSQALVSLTEAIKRYPFDPHYFRMVGIIQCETGNYAIGIANLNKAIQIDPTNPELFVDIGNCYVAKGDLALAEQYFNRTRVIAIPR